MGTRSASRRSDVEALVGHAAINAGNVGAQAARDAGVEAVMLGEHLRAVIDVARSGQRLSRVDVEACRHQGEEAANQGVALSALLDLYLSATWRLWDAIDARAPKSSAATVSSVAAALFRAADDAAEALARDLPEVEDLGEDEYFKNAAHAFPELLFVRSRTRFSAFDEPYLTMPLLTLVRIEGPIANGSTVKLRL